MVHKYNARTQNGQQEADSDCVLASVTQTAKCVFWCSCTPSTRAAVLLPPPPTFVANPPRGGADHRVRCCADATSRRGLLQGTSCATCSELGWQPGNGGKDVCADSKIAGRSATSTEVGGCVDKPAPWDVAEQLCLDVGARWGRAGHASPRRCFPRAPSLRRGASTCVATANGAGFAAIVSSEILRLWAPGSAACLPSGVVSPPSFRLLSLPPPHPIRDAAYFTLARWCCCGSAITIASGYGHAPPAKTTALWPRRATPAPRLQSPTPAFPARRQTKFTFGCGPATPRKVPGAQPTCV
jgi:hypothetical protein